MGQIIDITKRLKGRNQDEKPKKAKPAEVVDMTEAREAIINSERRVVKRTILNEFIGAFAVIPEKGLLKVALHDISEKGVSFNVEGSQAYFRQNQEVAMRLYLNHKTFFPFWHYWQMLYHSHLVLLQILNVQIVLNKNLCCLTKNNLIVQQTVQVV